MVKDHGRRSQSCEKMATQVDDFSVMEAKAAPPSPPNAYTTPPTISIHSPLPPSVSYSVSPIPIASSRRESFSSLEKEKKYSTDARVPTATIFVYNHETVLCLAPASGQKGLWAGGVKPLQPWGAGGPQELDELSLLIASTFSQEPSLSPTSPVSACWMSPGDRRPSF